MRTLLLILSMTVAHLFIWAQSVEKNIAGNADDVNNEFTSPDSCGTLISGQLMATPSVIPATSLDYRISPSLRNESMTLPSAQEVPIKPFNPDYPLGFNLWKGGFATFAAQYNQMPGLMDVQSGSFIVSQDIGRFRFSAVAVANKYWMPLNHNLMTQYGIGGTIRFNISDKVSLNAFGYSYNNNPIVPHAFAPYMNTSSYGGYADVKFGERWGANIGVCRYFNPLTGRWITDPIVNPYLKVGKSRLEFPIGNLLKDIVMGKRNYEPPRPVPQRAPQKPKKR